MPRGGRRGGRPGEKYPNRTDLATAPRTAPTVAITGQDYGQATATAQTQQAVTAAAQAVRPPAVNFHDPNTDNPNEPVTAGLRTGPGPGPEVLGLPSRTSDLLRKALLEYPDADDIRDLVEILGEQGE